MKTIKVCGREIQLKTLATILESLCNKKETSIDEPCIKDYLLANEVIDEAGRPGVAFNEYYSKFESTIKKLAFS